MTNENPDCDSFEEFGLAPSILKSLEELGYSTPTPIQQQAIPLILNGHDILGLAQTGTGKTAAFGLPLIQQLMGIGSNPDAKTIRALVLSPTRELANQIADNLKGFLRKTHLRVATVVGGQSINVQQRNLGRGNDILVATPGRLLDLVDRRAVYLDSASFLVLDEADQMLDLGFIHALKKISKLVAKERQTLLFSATMPKEIEGLAKAYLRDPVRVEVAPPGKAADKIDQVVLHMGRREKPARLRALLAENPDDISLVFARTKYGAEKLMKGLVAQGFPAGSIHGNKSQGQRDRAIRAFKSGEIRILVATDVAARGIDISGVSHVYNYDLPEVPANYVHRIGRTARAGAEGKAVAFCAPDEMHLLKSIEKEMGAKIPVVGTIFGDTEIEMGVQKAAEKKRNRGKPGARRGSPERREKNTGKKGRASSGRSKNASAQLEEQAGPVMDDFAVVQAAGFTGKPNSKKNRKRFGFKASRGGKTDKGDAGATDNRHAPGSRKKARSASAAAKPTGGRSFVAKDSVSTGEGKDRQAKASKNHSARAGQGGFKGRRRKK